MRPSKSELPAVPASLIDVALIDAPTSAAAGSMSISAWHELVRTGEAPQPVIRAPRFTRWRLADVRAYLVKRADDGSDSDAAKALTDRARKASAEARKPKAVAKARSTRAERVSSRAAAAIAK